MYRTIREIIDRGSRFLITSHIDPDGDAVGSSLAWYWALMAEGKDVDLFLADPIPYQYTFLPRPSKIFNRLPERAYDGLFVLDCSTLERVGPEGEALRDIMPMVNIDHHLTGPVGGAINLRNPGASSTGELIYDLMKALDMPIIPNAAINLYTAVLTDTGSFRFPNTNEKAFIICREMVQCGVEPSYVASMVYENHPMERFRLLGMTLSTLESYGKGKMVVARVTKEMFQETGTTREHSDGFVEFIKQVRGAEVAVLIRELKHNEFKISMRSKGQVDAARACNAFGGGGHKNAAGCIVGGNETQVIEKLKEVLELQ
jgi:phosphoesterase RecJ-like protein